MLTVSYQYIASTRLKKHHGLNVFAGYSITPAFK